MTLFPRHPIRWLEARGVVAFMSLFWSVGLATGQSPAGQMPQPVKASTTIRRQYAEQSLAQAQQGLEMLQSRMAPLQAELDALIEQARGLKASPPQVPEQAVKKVEFRPPRASRATKETRLTFVCENKRVTYMDFVAINNYIRSPEAQKSFAEVLAAATKEQQTKERLLSVPAGHYDFNYRVVFEGGKARESATFIRKVGHEGETVACLQNPNSEFRRRVDNVRADETFVTFNVYPSSFDVFRELRHYVWELRIAEVGWDFFAVDESIFAGAGGGVQQGN